jgi:hypothetical protein
MVLKREALINTAGKSGFADINFQEKQNYR